MLGIAGLATYNWWLLTPLVPGLIRSPNELFSNLEVTGQPYATAMQHADLVSGLLLATAFLLVGSRSIRADREGRTDRAGRAGAADSVGRGEWAAMLVFAVSGGLGGVFPEVCADEVSAACRRVEWRFQLPVSQYLHMAVGVVEFGAITLALLLAYRRTRDTRSRRARLYRELVIGALVAYPLLGVAYLADRLGGLTEPVFFVGFTMMVLIQLAERTSSAGTGSADTPAPVRSACQSGEMRIR
jgi:Protein of unknown function (DUF998)